MIITAQIAKTYRSAFQIHFIINERLVAYSPDIDKQVCCLLLWKDRQPASPVQIPDCMRSILFHWLCLNSIGSLKPGPVTYRCLQIFSMWMFVKPFIERELSHCEYRRHQYVKHGKQSRISLLKSVKLTSQDTFLWPMAFQVPMALGGFVCWYSTTN